MQAASLELSKQLYEVSGWNDTSYCYNHSPVYRLEIRKSPKMDSAELPAYDLGFLIRKLSVLPIKLRNKRSGDWAIAYRTGGANEREYLASGKTPEDTCARLALALFEAGILTREGDA